MKQSSRKSNNSVSNYGIFAIVLCLIVIFASVILIGIVIKNNNPFSIKKEKSNEVVVISQEEKTTKYELSKDMHAIWVMDEEIDSSLIENIESLQIIDTIILNTTNTDAISAIKEKGYKYYLTYDVSSCVNEKMPEQTQPIPNPQQLIDAEYIDEMVLDIKEFVGEYKPNGIILDGYFNILDKYSYERYLQHGSAMGYDNYVSLISKALIKNAKETIESIDPQINIGLFCEANLPEGNANVSQLAKDGLCDFICVKAYSSTIDTELSFEDTISKYDIIAMDNDIPMYVVHSAYKAGSKLTGWTEYDQIARQVIASKECNSYSGSIFNSLSNMLLDPEEFATKLIGYYDGTVKAEHIMQELEIVRPSEKEFTTNNFTVSFAGNTDPNTFATINDKQIVVDENGYFQFDAELTEGLNTFVIYHKGQTQTYKVTRITEIVRSVNPSEGTINVDGDTTIEISAVAYSEAEVYAKINGEKIKLLPVDEKDDTDIKETPYIVVSGKYKVPTAKTAVQNLGKVEVVGTWNGNTKSKSGATIKVNEKALPEDGHPIRVTANLAKVFNGQTMSTYADPNTFPLPKGALDYALGEPSTYTVNDDGETYKYTFYKLQSGLRVLADDIEAVKDELSPSKNAIKDVTVISDEDVTKVILDTEQQVSFEAKYTNSAIVIRFNYTESMPDDLKLSQNPLFSKITFTSDTMTLTLRQAGHFVGYDAHFDKTGDLVLEFKNPPDVYTNGLQNVNIVIDPGHGGKDVGALGFSSAYPESVINWNIASYLADYLEDYGANITLINTENKYYTLQERVDIAEDADADLFISIHNNSSSNNSATGSEAYYFNSWSSPFASMASEYMSQALESNDRGGKYGLYYVTRTMSYPAILCEGGFVSNAFEYNKLVDSSYEEQLGQNLGAAVINYLAGISSDNYVYGTESTGINLYDAGRN